MPVLQLTCPDCGHEYRSLVMTGARVPPVWVCSACGGRAVQPRAIVDVDPLSGGSGTAPACGCGCG